MNFKSKLAGASLICLAVRRSRRNRRPPDTTPVSPLVITATKIATPLDQVASSITLITADQIADHQWRTLPDALQDVPGLNLVQVGGPGGVTSVFIRGANSNQTKVILDGIEVNDPSQNDAFDFGQVLTSDIDKVEVLRGPQGSLYGADALGGVINIVTRKGDGATAIHRQPGRRVVRHLQPDRRAWPGRRAPSISPPIWPTTTPGRPR